MLRASELRPPTRWRIAAVLLGLLVFVFSWFFRFNNPEGSFAGLTDDHFFYLIRGWQLLYGDLPVRDFVDQGAPAYYYVAAAIQVLLGRGTLSEFTVSVTLIATAATLTFWLCLRASRSLFFSVLGTAFQVFLAPRMYNYPKILTYTAAIPLLWWFAERPGAWPRFWVALITVIAFLFRHDHGAFVAVAFVALLLFDGQLAWRVRLRHALMYAAIVIALVSPYLLYVEVNGGLRSYFSQAAAWAARDRERAPVIWPGLFDYPDGRSAAAENGALPVRTVAAIQDNAVAFLYYLELVLPLFAAAVLAVSRDGFRPSWPRAGPKIAVVVVLAILLNAGFLRSPLAARLADPSVPHAILIAWLGIALPRLWRSPQSWRPALAGVQRPLAMAVCTIATPLIVMLWVASTVNLYDRLDNAAMGDRPGKPLEQAARVVQRLRTEWHLSNWTDRKDRPDLITLAMYLQVCTPPGSRVFMQPYFPQVLGLAQRGFAGGHADLRPGFFNTVDAQQLTLERLRRQRVPVAILQSGAEYRTFRESFPLIADYLDQQYEQVGTHTFDERFGTQLLARKGATPTSTYALLNWPCYG